MPDAPLEEWIAKAAKIYADLKRLSEESNKSISELLKSQEQRPAQQQQQSQIKPPEPKTE